MIMKIIINPEDNMTEVCEISEYYTEPDYLEVVKGKEVNSGLKEIINQEGEIFITEDGEGDNFWKEIIILTDAGFELLKIENLEWEEIQKELEAN